MASTGIQLDNKTKETLEAMKLGKNAELLVMQIVEKKEIKVIEELTKCTYDDFKSFLTQHRKECFYLVYDFKDGVNATAGKLLLVTWVPDDAKNPQDKMIYAATKKAITDKFDGFKASVQANDLDDVSLNTLKECVKRGR